MPADGYSLYVISYNVAGIRFPLPYCLPFPAYSALGTVDSLLHVPCSLLYVVYTWLTASIM